MWRIAIPIHDWTRFHDLEIMKSIMGWIMGWTSEHRAIMDLAAACTLEAVLGVQPPREHVANEELSHRKPTSEETPSFLALSMIWHATSL
eukprot:967644-Pelagomonas_calceolata.AAC.4